MSPGIFQHRPLVGCLIAACMIGAAVELARTWSGAPSLQLGLWVLCCVAAESLWLRLPVGNVTLSMAITANFAAMLLLPPGHALAAIAASTLLAETVFMRKAPERALFNASQSTLAAAAGIAVLDAFGVAGSDAAALPLDARAGIAWLGAAIAYTVVNTTAVSLMVGLEYGISPWRAWRVNFGTAYEIVSNGTLFSLGALLAVLVSRVGPAAGALVAMPVLLAWVSYRKVLERTPAPAVAPLRRVA